jgi:cell wall-associated NlpC family hydrolase
MNVNDFVGLPYRAGARGPDAFDCYGIIAEVYLKMRGIVLPDFYQRGPGAGAASSAIAASLSCEVGEGRARLTDDVRDFDIAVVRSPASPHHVGVVIENGVLHAGAAFGSAWHAIPRFVSLYPKTEFYRWQP